MTRASRPPPQSGILASAGLSSSPISMKAAVARMKATVQTPTLGFTPSSFMVRAKNMQLSMLF